MLGFNSSKQTFKTIMQTHRTAVKANYSEAAQAKLNITSTLKDLDAAIA